MVSRRSGVSYRGVSINQTDLLQFAVHRAVNGLCYGVCRHLGFVGDSVASIPADRRDSGVQSAGAHHPAAAVRHTAKSNWHIPRYSNCSTLY